MEENGKTINDIVIENEVAVLPDVKYVEDIKMLWEFAINENYEKYVALKNNADGTITRYAFDGIKPIIIKDGEYGINLQYKVPAEPTEVVDKLEEVKEEPIIENDTNNEETEEIIENEIVETEVNDNTEQENVSRETLENESEEKQERSVEEINAILEKSKLVDELANVVAELKLENQKLKDENVSLQTEISKLNSELDTFKLENEPVLTEVELTLEDVIKFLKNNDIKTIGV